MTLSESHDRAPGRPSRVALATAAGDIDEDVDLPRIVAALRNHGIDARAIPWDLAGCDWSTVDLVIIRSTWNYDRRLEEFLGWIDAVSTQTGLRNPAQAIHWNSDKRYLADLRRSGVPTVGTEFFEPGSGVRIPATGDFVIKPAVAAGAREAARYRQDQRELALRHAAKLHASGNTILVQPYLVEIHQGERSLIFFNGFFSHAIMKGPLLTVAGEVDNKRVAHPNPVPYSPTSAEMALAYQAMRSAPGTADLLFARVDIALDDNAEPVIMEVELIEPNLFLTPDFLPPGTERLDRFLDAIAAQLETITGTSPRWIDHTWR